MILKSTGKRKKSNKIPKPYKEFKKIFQKKMPKFKR